MTSVMWIMGCNPLCVGARDDHARDQTSPHLVSRTNKIYCYHPQQWMRKDKRVSRILSGRYLRMQWAMGVCPEGCLQGGVYLAGEVHPRPRVSARGCLIGGVCLMGVCPGIYIPLPECILVAYYIFMVTAPFSKNKHSILKNRGGGV